MCQVIVVLSECDTCIYFKRVATLGKPMFKLFKSMLPPGWKCPKQFKLGLKEPLESEEVIIVTDAQECYDEDKLQQYNRKKITGDKME